MIWLTRIDGEQFMLNEDQLLYIEVSHDTMLVLSNGERVRVLEGAEQVADRITAWRRRVMRLEVLSEFAIESEESS